MILYDNQRRRMADTENGDYLLSQPANRDERVWYFNLYDQQDQPLLASIVQVHSIDGFGDSGGATLVRCVLQKTWIPTGRPDPPNCFNEYHPQIPRLAAFLEAQCYARGKQNAQLQFEFIDGRTGLRTKKPVKGWQIALGLLLTVGFHFVYVLLLSLFTLNAKPYFFIGFTQLLYMLPAIYLARDNRGLMMGLIIGASLTFLLGLPLAALAAICGSTMHYG